MNDKKEKFNVGDIVITLSNIELWNNIYYFKRFIEELKNAKTIKKIDKNLGRAGYFTTDEKIDLSSYYSRERDNNKFSIFNLDNGEDLARHRQCFNLTQNKVEIKKHLQEKFDIALKKCGEDDKKEINELEEQIAELQAKIEKIKKGERSLSFDSRINERKFINERIDEINHILDNVSE